MSARLVVDSSVAIKWVKPAGESDVVAAEALLDRQQSGEIELVVPGLMMLEVANSLWKYAATESQIKRALKALRSLHLAVVEPDAKLLDRAAELAVGCNITIYDALFAALADTLGCELVTADKKLAASGACKVRALA